MTAVRLDGVDVARYQREIDWQKVQATGVKFVAIKASRGTDHVDPMFARNRAGAAFARWKPLYHYLDYTEGQTEGAVVAQVEHFLKTIGALQPNEAVSCDAEVQPPKTLTDYAKRLAWLYEEAEHAALWCELVEAVTKRPCIVYGIKDMWRNKRLNNGKRPLHMAYWPDDPNDPNDAPADVDVAVAKGAKYGGVAGWQYTNKGRVAGVPTTVDLNMVLDEAAMDRAIKGEAVAVARKYLSGYNANQKQRTKAELMAWESMKLMHPEVLRRHFAMMDAAFDAGVMLGPGGAGRTRRQQVVLYESRYAPDPADTPPCLSGRGLYLGKCWVHIKGAAAAVPDLSYHQTTEPDVNAPDHAWALSIDMVGDMTWMKKNCTRFGLKVSTVEPWHTWPVEVPTNRANYRFPAHKLLTHALPQPAQPDPPPPPPPVPSPPPPTMPPAVTVADLSVGSVGNDVYMAQVILRQGCGQAIVIPDGKFGKITETAVRNVQMFFKIPVTGKIDKKTWAALHLAACNAPQQEP